MDDSDVDLSNELTLEQLRASLKRSTTDLVKMTNSSNQYEVASPVAAGNDSREEHSAASNEVGSSPINENLNSLGENVVDYQSLDVSPEIMALFTHIDDYDPVDLELETPLKCFIPPYIPAVGQVDPMIKISRPDGVDDGIGIARLDEVLTSEQSNAAVIELQLRNWSKTKQSAKSRQRSPVRKIKDARSSSKEINEWIQSVEGIHDNDHQASTTAPATATSNDSDILSIQDEMLEKVQKNELAIPSPDIDLHLADYARVLCTLIGIPNRDGSLIKSVHCMFDVFLQIEKKNNVSAHDFI